MTEWIVILVDSKGKHSRAIVNTSTKERAIAWAQRGNPGKRAVDAYVKER